MCCAWLPEQAQKELLDAELDFHKKKCSGEDTTDLKRKLGQLQVEVMHSDTERWWQLMAGADNGSVLYHGNKDAILRNASEEVGEMR